MKCLLCIFLRLIRTSRVSELEKLGTLSRSSNAFLRSRSFRVESGVNLNTSLISQKETGQQDPYGIFEIEDSLVRDIGPYKNLVRCTSSSLDMKNISSCLQLLSKLRWEKRIKLHIFIYENKHKVHYKLIASTFIHPSIDNLFTVCVCVCMHHFMYICSFEYMYVHMHLCYYNMRTGCSRPWVTSYCSLLLLLLLLLPPKICKPTQNRYSIDFAISYSNLTFSNRGPKQIMLQFVLN